MDEKDEGGGGFKMSGWVGVVRRVGVLWGEECAG